MADSSSSISVGDSPEVKEEITGFQFPPPPRLPTNGKNYEFILSLLAVFLFTSNVYLISVFSPQTINMYILPN